MAEFEVGKDSPTKADAVENFGEHVHALDASLEGG